MGNFYNKIIDYIDLIIDNYDNKDYYKKYLYNEFKSVESKDYTYICNYLSDCLNNLISTLKFIDNNTSNKSLLSDLSTFFIKNSVNTSIYFYNALLELSNALNKFLNEYFDKNMEMIKKYGLEKMFSDDKIISLIDLYLSINKIELDIIEYEESDDSYLASIEKSYLKEIHRIPLLTQEDQLELARKVKQGDIDAKNKMIEHNLRLVTSIAYKYTNRGVDFIDLVEEGNIGLMTAVERFDPERGFTFATYATYWIRQRIARYVLEMKDLIRKPSLFMQSYVKIDPIKERLFQELGREPTYEEIAAAAGMSVNEYHEMVVKSSDAMSYNVPVVTDEDADTELVDFISSEDDVESGVFNSFLKEDLINICNEVLKEKEREILFYRNGFYNNRVYTLSELGKMYNVTRERIRQIEAKALKKIIKSNKVSRLYSYTENEEASKKYIMSSRDFYRNNPYKHSTTHTEKGKGTIVNKNIFQVFEEVPKADVLRALSQLPEEYKEIVLKIHGGDLKLSTDHEVSIEEGYIYYRTILPYIAEKLNLKIKNYRLQKSIKDLFEGYDYNKVLNIIDNLSIKEKNLLYERCSYDFDDPKMPFGWKTKDGVEFGKICSRIKNAYKNNKVLKFKKGSEVNE